MTCTNVGTATTVQINNIFAPTGNWDPSLRYQFVFDVPVPVDATQFVFELGGTNYEVQIGCGFNNGESLLSSLDVDSILWESVSDIRYMFEGAPSLVGIEVGDILEVVTATNEINNGAFEIQSIRVGSSIGALDVDTIDWQAGTTVRIAFNGTPDLSNLLIGDKLTIASATNASNDGEFIISAINDGADYVDITNPARTDATDDEATDSPAVGTIELVASVVIENLLRTDATDDEFGASPAVGEILDGKILKFYQLPVGWTDNLPCDEDIEVAIIFQACTDATCCYGATGEVILVDSGIVELDSYHPADVDDTADPAYYGFLTSAGDWYVLRVSGINYQYAFPSYNPTYDNYQDALTNRATLIYKEWNDILS